VVAVGNYLGVVKGFIKQALCPEQGTLSRGLAGLYGELCMGSIVVQIRHRELLVGFGYMSCASGGTLRWPANGRSGRMGRGQTRHVKMCGRGEN
jgi:hypothetical protein